MNCDVALVPGDLRLGQYLAFAPLTPPSILREATSQLREMTDLVLMRWDEVDPGLKTRLRIVFAGGQVKTRAGNKIAAVAWALSTIWNLVVRREETMEYFTALVAFIEAVKKRLSDDLRSDILSDPQQMEAIRLGRDEISAGRFVPLPRR